MTMELLKTDFIRKGVQFKQLKRSDRYALYEVKRTPQYGTTVVTGYEVFKIGTAKAHTWPNGETTPEHEAYPGDNSFGKTAWYLSRLESAEERFEELSK